MASEPARAATGNTDPLLLGDFTGAEPYYIEGAHWQPPRKQPD